MRTYDHRVIVGGRREPPEPQIIFRTILDYSLMLYLTIIKLKSLRGVGGLVKNLDGKRNENDRVRDRTSCARAREKEGTKSEWTRRNLPRTLESFPLIDLRLRATIVTLVVSLLGRSMELEYAFAEMFSSTPKFAWGYASLTNSVKIASGT